MIAGLIRKYPAFAAIAVFACAGSLAGEDVVLVQPQPVAVAQPAGDTGALANVAGLHVAQDKNVSFPCSLTDGSGYVWDIQSYGGAGSGSNSAFGYAMRLSATGIYFTGTQPAWTNQKGDEIELSARERTGVRVYRRVKVFKDAGLARWLDVFENTSSEPASLRVSLLTYSRYAIGRTVTSSGGGSFGETDWGFVTEAQGGADVPALMFVVADAGAGARPTVQIQSGRVMLTYDLSIPAGQRVILCSFLSQDRSADNHIKRMKSFQAGKYLGDLSAGVRGLIANFRATDVGIETVALERSPSDDAVHLAAGDPIFGEVTNKSFTVEAVFGKVSLEADRVVGMAAAKEPEGTMRIVLTDGQVVCGRLPSEDKLLLHKAFGDLSIPFGRIRQWSYRISKERPLDTQFRGPYLRLRTGDQLAFEPNSVPLKLATKHGTVDLDGGQVLKITLEGGAAGGPHRVFYLNGSSLTGMVQPDKITPTLRLGPKMEIPRQSIRQIQYAAAGNVDGTLARMVLLNEDTLFGDLTEENYSLKTEYGSLGVKPENIRSITFDKADAGMATVHLWNNSVVRGRFDKEELAFQIVPGPALKVHVKECAGVVRTQAMPPEEIRKQVEKLIGQLASESYKDRQLASESLVRLGPSIVPVLQRHQKATKDPEVRARIDEVIERLGGKRTAAPPVPPRPVPRGPD